MTIIAFGLAPPSLHRCLRAAASCLSCVGTHNAQIMMNLTMLLCRSFLIERYSLLNLQHERFFSFPTHNGHAVYTFIATVCFITLGVSHPSVLATSTGSLLSSYLLYLPIKQRTDMSRRDHRRSSTEVPPRASGLRHDGLICMLCRRKSPT
jgi:hypothetical protein